MDPARASLFVVGLPVYTSYLAGTTTKGCGGTIQHYERMDNLAVSYTQPLRDPIFAFARVGL